MPTPRAPTRPGRRPGARRCPRPRRCPATWSSDSSCPRRGVKGTRWGRRKVPPGNRALRRTPRPFPVAGARVPRPARGAQGRCPPRGGRAGLRAGAGVGGGGSPQRPQGKKIGRAASGPVGCGGKGRGQEGPAVSQGSARGSIFALPNRLVRKNRDLERSLGLNCCAATHQRPAHPQYRPVLPLLPPSFPHWHSLPSSPCPTLLPSFLYPLLPSGSGLS